MPRYGYKCPLHGPVELTHGMNETPEVFCTHPLRDTEDLCGIVMARVFNPVGVTYKGNGFYTTDHKHVIRSHADVM